MTARQIEAGRRAITHYLRRGGKVWVRVFPDRSVTKKPQETRMGGGKANPEYWAAAVKRGRIIYEIGEVDEKTAQDALRLADDKLPIHTKMVRKGEAAK